MPINPIATTDQMNITPLYALREATFRRACSLSSTSLLIGHFLLARNVDRCPSGLRGGGPVRRGPGVVGQAEPVHTKQFQARRRAPLGGAGARESDRSLLALLDARLLRRLRSARRRC